ncbi:uncharacterized protein LY89DRAFT_781014 [Mollisia scopiformis]|uniref:Uncharacterized protein n=1 Tax=Mollisia scopiformis TaxID=149040 RepID=A0A194XDQ5_MOLSC|nr:uncharacterized protein LY89DRAFT_781014 [Mollisia scopiformis]KUJ17882.1 hypothetical protein LY89DRAFT_781014 [Mollisia scopiformis]
MSDKLNRAQGPVTRTTRSKMASISKTINATSSESSKCPKLRWTSFGNSAAEQESLPPPQSSQAPQSSPDYANADIPSALAAINLMAIAYAKNNPHLCHELQNLSHQVQVLETNLPGGVEAGWIRSELSEATKRSLTWARVRLIELMVDILQVLDRDEQGSLQRFLSYVKELGNKLK